MLGVVKEGIGFVGQCILGDKIKDASKEAAEIFRDSVHHLTAETHRDVTHLCTTMERSAPYMGYESARIISETVNNNADRLVFLGHELSDKVESAYDVCLFFPDAAYFRYIATQFCSVALHRPDYIRVDIVNSVGSAHSGVERILEIYNGFLLGMEVLSAHFCLDHLEPFFTLQDTSLSTLYRY